MRRAASLPHLVLAAIALASDDRAAAQLASLVADLNPLLGSDAGSEPQDLVSLRGKALFAAFELEPPGQHLWASDGTARGTVRLADEVRFAAHVGPLGDRHLWLALRPNDREVLMATDGTREGTVSLTPPEVYPDSRSLTRVGPAFFFLAYPSEGGGPRGASLWRTDATSAGTSEVPGLGGRFLDLPSAALGEYLYFFTADAPGDEVRRVTLWRSDGTAARTAPVVPVGVFEPFESPDVLVSTPSRLFFVAPGRRGRELWASDGTAAGTRPITEFAADEAFLGSRFFKALGNRLYFGAMARENDIELWVSDGTPAGTHPATRFAQPAPFGGAYEPQLLEAVGEEVVFLATTDETGRELWSTDGSPERTRLLADICPGPCWGVPEVSALHLGGRLFFSAFDPARGWEPWATDGTPQGTVPLADTCAGECGNLSTFAAAGEEALFHGLDAEHGFELWASDGTPQGTRLLTDLDLFNPFGYGAGAVQAARAGERILFGADDGYLGMELWRTGGGPGRERLVTDLARGGEPGSDPIGLLAKGEEVFFFACVGQGVALLRSDGTAAGTHRAFDLPGHDCVNFYNAFYQADPPMLAAAGDLVYLNLARLWRSDGTPEGTVPLTPFDPLNGFPVVVSAMVPFRSGAAFAMLTAFGPAGEYEMELWASDGTAEGTAPLGLFPGPIDLRDLTAVGEELYFLADDGEHGWEAWTSDGTTVGTRRLTDRVFDGPPEPRTPAFVRAGEAVYFALAEAPWGSDLWQTDGTAEGTRRLAGLFGEHQARGCRHLTAFDGALVFVGTLDPEGRPGLWRTEGTAETTTLLAALSGTADLGAVSRPVVLGSRLFVLSGDFYGQRFWASDGTPAGTSLVPLELPAAFLVPQLAAAGGRLYFPASDWAHGIELWTSDGTAAGTRLAHDLAPGRASGLYSPLPAELVAAGSRLFFAADDGLWGRELWSVPPGPGSACVPGPAALCLAGGRLRAEAVFRSGRGAPEPAGAAALGAESGGFSFARPENLDLLLKLVDGTAVNGHGWAFVGSLSNLDFALTLSDAVSGATRRYENLAGRFASFADLEAVSPGGALWPGLVRLPEAPPPDRRSGRGEQPGTAGASDRERRRLTAPPTARPAGRRSGDPIGAGREACAAGPTQLCLLGGRFAVEVTWEDPGGEPSAAGTAPWSDAAGTFWFRSPSRVEVGVKILDGRAVNGHVWLFSTSLTSLAYTVRVTDTATGLARAYRSAAGSFTAFGDLEAF